MEQNKIPLRVSFTLLKGILPICKVMHYELRIALYPLKLSSLALSAQVHGNKVQLICLARP